MTAPTASGPWWRDDGDPTQPVRITADLYWRRDYEKFVQPVTDDGHWLAPVLTTEQAAALTARAERAERERDEARATLDAVRDALGNGADESAWPPGLTVAEAVAQLRLILDRKAP